MARFGSGDVVRLADGHQWTVASWPHSDVGTFSYYRDEVEGDPPRMTRTWGTAWTGIANTKEVYDSEGLLVHSEGERVDEMAVPVLVRRGSPEANRLIVSDNVLADLAREEGGEPETEIHEVGEAEMDLQDRVIVKVGDTVEVVMRGVVADAEAPSTNQSFSIKYGDTPHNQMKYWINQGHSNVVEVKVLSHPYLAGDLIDMKDMPENLPVGSLAMDNTGRHLLWCADGTWRGAENTLTTVLPATVTLVFVPEASA
jgi:hypothetical protein